MNKKAVLTYVTGNVKRISNSENFGEMFEVNDRTVRIVKKKSNTYLLCDCPVNSVHAKSNPICYHKLAVILYCLKEIWE